MGVRIACLALGSPGGNLALFAASHAVQTLLVVLNTAHLAHTHIVVQHPVFGCTALCALGGVGAVVAALDVAVLA